MWIENTEGAKFWMKVFNDLKTRGVADMLIGVTDGCAFPSRVTAQTDLPPVAVPMNRRESWDRYPATSG